MSFSVRRNYGDQRQLRQFAKPLMALVDMIAEGDWERAVTLADGIAQDCRLEALLAELKELDERRSTP